MQFSILPWWLHMWLIWAYIFSLFMDSHVKELISCADAHLTWAYQSGMLFKIAFVKVERQTAINIISLIC